MNEEWTFSFRNSKDKVVTRTISVTPKQMAGLATQKLIQIMQNFSEDEDSMDEVLSIYVTVKKDVKGEGPKPWDLPNGKMIQPKT